MMLHNYNERIKLYLDSNPKLDHNKIGILLLLDNLYRAAPDDLAVFRDRFAHMDPTIIDTESATSGIIFLKIANSNEPISVIKHRLNSYLNIKNHYIGNYKSYEENMILYKKYSAIASAFISDLLEVGNFPQEISDALQEKDEVRKCNDFYDLLMLYKHAKQVRLRYEILRKLGIIVLLSRLRKSFNLDDLDFALENVLNVFNKGMGLGRKEPVVYYIWLDSDDKVMYTDDLKKAEKEYAQECRKRQKLALKNYPLQSCEIMPHKTKFGSEILHFEARNKFKKNDDAHFSSVLEKILRKNLEFPNQVRDVLGVKVVVDNEDQIEQLVNDLESFLGGSSTRKKEKNALNKFGKKKLGKHSSKEYYVWKAVYDVTLPHPSISNVTRMMELTKGNAQLQSVLRKRLEFFKDRPKDFVVELQLQDLNSYFLSIAKGSPTDHSYLKMNQIRFNSFYKVFPKEIYEEELDELRDSILTSV